MPELPLFQQQQKAFSAHIRNPDSCPMPKGMEDRRVAIYRDLIFNNIEGFVASAFPIIRTLYADDVWNTMVRDFIVRHRCNTPYFLQISQEFLKYLQDTRGQVAGDPAGLLELAHYEWVELGLSVSEQEIDLEGIDVNGDLMAGHPVLSPLAWPLNYAWPVHRMGPDYLPETVPEETTYLVVYRDEEEQVKFMEINAVTARMLALLVENPRMSGLEMAALIAKELSHPDLAAVEKGAAETLQGLKDRRILLGVAK